MIKEFKENVEKLFHMTVTREDVQPHIASELLHLLECKVTLPVKSIWEGDCLRMIYYNVSLEIKDDLSLMTVSYNSDYTVQMRKISCCDLYQLADFVLALERDIPRWKHIWIADEKLRKEKARMEERRKMAMREIRSKWIESNGSMPEDVETSFRIRFYNIKALDLMLKNGNPFWENKKTEEEILDQCHLYHVEPQMEQWYEEWTEFTHDCERDKKERERVREEYRNKLMKMRHFINIKMLKINALIKTVEFHPLFIVSTVKHFDENTLGSKKFGLFIIKVHLDRAYVSFGIKYDLVDVCMGKVIENLKKANDLMPELQRSLSNESKNCQLGVDSEFGRFVYLPLNTPLKIVAKKGKCQPSLDLESFKIVNRINDIFNELWKYIKCEEKKRGLFIA